MWVNAVYTTLNLGQFTHILFTTRLLVSTRFRSHICFHFVPIPKPDRYSFRERDGFLHGLISEDKCGYRALETNRWVSTHSNSSVVCIFACSLWLQLKVVFEEVKAKKEKNMLSPRKCYSDCYCSYR